MSWDIDAMSVLPEDWQEEIMDNFSPEYLAERLSDYIVILQEEMKGKYLVSEKSIAYLYDQWPSAYRKFYELVDK